MKRHAPWVWPLLVGGLSLALTAGLWQHERETQQRALRDNFDFAVRQMASRIDERLAGYEQMLRGVRGLFDASDQVTAQDFATYVDLMTAGNGFAGLRTIGHASHLAGGQAPLIYAQPLIDALLQDLGRNLLADPVSAEALRRAGESGGLAVSRLLRADDRPGPSADATYLLFLPLYARGRPTHDAGARQANLTGWVLLSFRVGELMSSLYGEGTPGLALRIHDGVQLQESNRLFPAEAEADWPQAARFKAQEYIGLGGHTWTLSMRSTPEFEASYSQDAVHFIAIGGSGLSLALALLAWQLATSRERAQAAARQMTRELSESSERYRRIVDTANEGIWMVDAAGRTAYVNPKLQSLLGYPADELLGRSWLDFMDDAGREALGGTSGERLHPGRGEQLDVRFLRRDGSDLWATLSTSAIRDANGAHAGVLAMLTDVTEHRRSLANRAQLEDQLRQAQKIEAVGTLAGGIAHDFNNILAAILGNVGLAHQQLDDRHPAALHLAQIRRAGERGRSLVQQIVAFSRQQPQQRQNQPLRPLLEEAARLLRSMLPAGVELNLRLADPGLQVRADATQLQQVLLNLGTNAWHAMAGRPGRIVVGLDAVMLSTAEANRLGGLSAGLHARVQVSDNGCGMDAVTRQRIFEPFFTTKPVGQGTGLGLSVVHGIVKLHGGAIQVHSAPDQGSCFDLYFPSAGAPTQAAPAALLQEVEAEAPAGTGEPGRGEHVLYVDDDPVMLMLVESLLQRAGYRVSCLEDPRAALQRACAEDDPVDLLITDFNMPELSGLDIAQRLQALRPQLPVVITTGYVSESLHRQAALSGVRQVLQKEYTLEQLVDVVSQLLAAGDTATPAAAAS